MHETPNMTQFSLGPGGAEAALRVLGGEPAETLFREAQAAAGAAGEFVLRESGGWMVGAASVAVDTAGLEAAAERLHAELFAAAGARGRRVARIWNYVPAINAAGAGGLENYRVFCRGRARALERSGVAVPPAASAVGGASGRLTLMFAAAAGAEPRFFENPDQVPAYEYPEDYGPRAPSFSRAAQVRAEDGRRWTFVSGTAAIKGHRSVARGELGGQIECTLDNLRLISAACGLGEALGAGRAGGAAAERHFKIYLRRAEDLAAARVRLEGALLRAGDRVSWLRADVCREELLIEIEATVVE